MSSKIRRYESTSISKENRTMLKPRRIGIFQMSLLLGLLIGFLIPSFGPVTSVKAQFDCEECYAACDQSKYDCEDACIYYPPIPPTGPCLEACDNAWHDCMIRCDRACSPQ